MHARVIVVRRFLQLLLLLESGVEPLLQNCLAFFAAGVLECFDFAHRPATVGDVAGANARHGEDCCGAARVSNLLITLFNRLLHQWCFLG